MKLTIHGRDAYAYTGGKPFDPALPCVVFIHGALHDHSVWTLLARWCAHHAYSVLAPDLPGHMKSAGPALESVEAMADWVLGLLDAAGVKQAAPAAQETAAPATKPAEKSHEQSTLPPEVQAAANVAELPVVTVRQNGNETIEEYRKKGKLLFVRVLEKQGPTKFYVDNPAVIPPNLMQQLSGPSGVVQPVYYKLADWK